MRVYIENDNSGEYVVSVVEPLDENTQQVIEETRWSYNNG